MGFVFTTGTINDANAAAVGLAMAEKIRDDVVAHPAWDLVEEFTPAGGLLRWYVFKCLAAQSGLPADYFVVIGRILSSGALRAFVCENYNVATHAVAQFPHGNPNTTVLHDSLGRNSTSYVLPTADLPTNNQNTPGFNSWAPSGVSTKWWIIVSEEGFTVAFNGASNGFFHLGTYEPLSILPIPMPLTGFSNTNQPLPAFITANPAVASVTATSRSHYANNMTLGFAGPLNSNDKLQNNQRPVAEVGMTMQDAGTGWALGKHKRVRIGQTGTAPGGIAFGDSYALEGRLWVPYLPTDFYLWDTGVAA